MSTKIKKLVPVPSVKVEEETKIKEETEIVTEKVQLERKMQRSSSATPSSASVVSSKLIRLRLANPNNNLTQTKIKDEFAYADYGGIITLTGFQISNTDLDSKDVVTWAQELSKYVDNAQKNNIQDAGSRGKNAILIVTNEETNEQINITLMHIPGRKTIIVENPFFDPPIPLLKSGTNRVSIETSNGRGNISGGAVISKLVPGKIYTFDWKPDTTGIQESADSSIPGTITSSSNTSLSPAPISNILQATNVMNNVFQQGLTASIISSGLPENLPFNFMMNQNKSDAGVQQVPDIPVPDMPVPDMPVPDIEKTNIPPVNQSRITEVSSDNVNWASFFGLGGNTQSPPTEQPTEQPTESVTEQPPPPVVEQPPPPVTQQPPPPVIQQPPPPRVSLFSPTTFGRFFGGFGGFGGFTDYSSINKYENFKSSYPAPITTLDVAPTVSFRENPEPPTISGLMRDDLTEFKHDLNYFFKTSDVSRQRKRGPTLIQPKPEHLPTIKHLYGDGSYDDIDNVHVYKTQ